MQSKGAIRLVAILLLVACLWQLSFTLVTAIQNNKAKKYAEAAAVAVQSTPAFAKVAAEDQAYYLDSIKKDQQKWYTDSISNEKVYFGYKFKDVRSKEINLGLDLKGGMNVMLQVQLEDLVKALSGNSTEPQFLKALDLAKTRSVNSQSDFITLFAEAMKETAPGTRLAQIFGTYEMRDRIKPESTDEQVVSVITQPSIQKIGNTGRILVELPGVKEPERVRKLLQGTASLEFWPTFTFDEMSAYLDEANSRLAELLSANAADAPAETAPASSETIYPDAAKAEAKEKAESYRTEMPEDAQTSTSHKSTVISSLNEEVAEWLFDAERKEGDSEVFTMKEDETSFVTVRFDSRDNNDYHRMKANILTVTKDKEGTELKEGEQSAKDKFDALVKAVENGMSDEAFSEAVTALGYSVSTVNVSHTSYTEEIRSWLYEEGRKSGDVKTDYENDTTYYLIRFVGVEEDSYRDSLIKDELWTTKTNEIGSAKEIQFVEDMMQYAKTDLTFNTASSQN